MSEGTIAVIVASIGAAATIVVAWLQHRTRKDMKTNHGSENIGDATDRNTSRLIDISKTMSALHHMFTQHLIDAERDRRDWHAYVEQHRGTLDWARTQQENAALEGKD